MFGPDFGDVVDFACEVTRDMLAAEMPHFGDPTAPLTAAQREGRRQTHAAEQARAQFAEDNGLFETDVQLAQRWRIASPELAEASVRDIAAHARGDVCSAGCSACRALAADRDWSDWSDWAGRQQDVRLHYLRGCVRATCALCKTDGQAA